MKCQKVINLSTNNLELIVHGQGVLLFKNNNVQASVFKIMNEYNDGLIIYIDNASSVVKRISNNSVYGYSNKGLIDNSDASYWFSLDSQNLILRIGIGEARLETQIFNYEFPKDNLENIKQNKSFLESLKYITDLINTTPIKLIRDPIVTTVPLVAKLTNELTMDDVASNNFLPHSNLSSTAQKLYECISGEKFVLDTIDFPDFSKAIEYSIATPGLWCHEKLKEKSTEFNPSKPNINETYLRITLGLNNGESPGIPYVMEIWPSNHYSPIHSHASTHAIIRVLHGDINVDLYPFLSKKPLDSFASKTFYKDEITWISPQLNQVHQLTNKNPDTTCITIQCYMYGQDNLIHYEYFDYVNEDGNIELYDPDSDMDFISFKKLMKEEWNNKKD